MTPRHRASRRGIRFAKTVSAAVTAAALTTLGLVSSPAAFASTVVQVSDDSGLAHAFHNATDGTVIELIQDITATSDVTACMQLGQDGVTATLDLNGHHLTKTTPNDAYCAGIGVPEGTGLVIEDPAGGGTLDVTGGKYSAGIGGGAGSSNTPGTIDIKSGAVTATGGSSGAGIGGGQLASGGTIGIEGGTVTAQGGAGAAGIGGGIGGPAGTIALNGGTVVATGGSNGAGVGGGENGDGGDITIDTHVTATGGSNGAGIGSGRGGDAADITISGGPVTAQAQSDSSAAIGGGTHGGAGDISIASDVSVTADGAIAMGPGLDGTSFGSLSNAGSLTLNGSFYILEGTIVTNSGTIDVSGDIATQGTIDNSGTIDGPSSTITYLSDDDDDTTPLTVYTTTVPDFVSSLRGFYGTPSRTGYVFDDWYDATTGGQTVAPGTPVTENLTLYAHWNVEVLFKGNDGTNYDIVRTPEGTTISAPTPPGAAEGYTFDGWYTAADGGTAWNFDSDTVTGALTLYPHWSAVPYTVTFDSRGGSAVDAATVHYGDTVAVPSDPTRTGYAFQGWYSNPGYGPAWGFSSDTVTADLTLYAHWNVEVLFKGNDGTNYDIVRTPEGTTISAPTPPGAAEGYTFDGWYTAADGGTAWNFDSDTVTGALTLYAHWTAADAVSSTTTDPAGMSAAGTLLPTLAQTGWDAAPYALSALLLLLAGATVMLLRRRA